MPGERPRTAKNESCNEFSGVSKAVVCQIRREPTNRRIIAAMQ